MNFISLFSSSTPHNAIKTWLRWQFQGSKSNVEKSTYSWFGIEFTFKLNGLSQKMENLLFKIFQFRTEYISTDSTIFRKWPICQCKTPRPKKLIAPDVRQVGSGGSKWVPFERKLKKNFFQIGLTSCSAVLIQF